jgi:hypothetical protein
MMVVVQLLGAGAVVDAADKVGRDVLKIVNGGSCMNWGGRGSLAGLHHQLQAVRTAAVFMGSSMYD